MKKVSVVVPAYNAQKTIEKCISSLVNQTLEDIEIIVVNDASTDDTWDIIQGYEKKYPEKMVIIDGGVNRGSGGARNLGFDMATGEYIGLVDSDDYVASSMYELLYKKAREDDADIVDCGFYSEAMDKAIVYTSDDLTGKLDAEKRNRLITTGGYLVTKIFKNNLWNDPKIRMREHIRCLEDTEILIYMFLKADRISNVKEVLYNYSDIASSATKTMDLQTYFDSIYGAIESIYRVCHELPNYYACKEAIEYAIINIYSYGINRCLYDQIERFGASPQNIKKYFNNVGYKEKQLLCKLAQLKKHIPMGKYEDNIEVVRRINNLDIMIMKECDLRF
ncbi:glycosyltransferase family 2 protein [Butyrivibrio sp. YAB3001]|uniref:glycosyltransferase family 2 protein n=1 Tax=Butyrivibrio sp. YAB3001 TaxID=1520812 RepID=UPI0008F6250C|nr:glycosyltransferase family 2 protein [Butyrivibrio sp. YAB3001]SFB95197.1 Glycosyltransferase involved in cell wall bisynthesis [Butyrivibrio sp. YAB3001]